MRGYNPRVASIVLAGSLSPFELIYPEGPSIRYADFFAHIQRSDLKKVTRRWGPWNIAEESSVLEVIRPHEGEFSELHAYARNGSSTELEIILQEFSDLLAQSCKLVLYGFRVGGQQFADLLRRFETIDLDSCHIGRGWWHRIEDQRCEWLILRGCTGVPPKTSVVSSLASPALKNLWIFGSSHSLIGSTAPGYPARDTFARSVVKSFWSQQLEFLIYWDAGPLDWIESLSRSAKLTTLHLSPATPEVLEWVVRNPKIQDLYLNWSNDIRLPLSRLCNLQRLGHLDVSSTPFDDEDLRAVSEHKRIRVVTAFYTKLTPASWPIILGWPNLYGFWGSKELQGDPGFPLPAESDLKEFVALNANTAWFKEFLSGYPGIEIVQM